MPLLSTSDGKSREDEEADELSRIMRGGVVFIQRTREAEERIDAGFEPMPQTDEWDEELGFVPLPYADDGEDPGP